ncbi:hypothetical protein LTR10_014816 [Elasticomyces elasticus]|nr:hypothetical protein LTR10_014816 [Elasticomyces elasticus]
MPEDVVTPDKVTPEVVAVKALALEVVRPEVDTLEVVKTVAEERAVLNTDALAVVEVGEEVEEVEPIELATTVVLELEETLVVLEKTEDVTVVVEVALSVVVLLTGWMEIDEVTGSVVGVTAVLAAVVASQSLQPAGSGILLGLERA